MIVVLGLMGPPWNMPGLCITLFKISNPNGNDRTPENPQVKSVGSGIWPKFELIQDSMHVLVTCKNEIQSNSISPIISLWGFFQTLHGSYLSNSSKIDTARMKEIQSKMKALEWAQHFYYNLMGAICCHRNESTDPIWSKT